MIGAHIDRLVGLGATLCLWGPPEGQCGGHIEIPGRHYTSWLSAGGANTSHAEVVRMLDESARHFLIGLSVTREG